MRYLDACTVSDIHPSLAANIVEKMHYLHRRPPISFALGLFREWVTIGVCTFGTPPSRHLQMIACPSRPSLVIELNRLWVDDAAPRNTESWFVSRCLAMMPSRIVVSYADTARGHAGYVYRALNFRYAGITDSDRKTPRFDYITPGKHSRDAFRNGYTEKVRREPKHKYWTTTGNRRQRSAAASLCGWPTLSWERIEAVESVRSAS